MCRILNANKSLATSVFRDYMNLVNSSTLWGICFAMYTLPDGLIMAITAMTSLSVLSKI